LEIDGVIEEAFYQRISPIHEFVQVIPVEDATDDSIVLQDVLRRDLTTASAIGLMVFFAFALQCMSTVAVMRRETAGWKWPILQFTYMLTLAYAGAFVAFRVF
jgi:ferrous iron transport protein B